MVAYIKDLAVQKRRWIDEASFQRGVALCQTIPGATAMQTAAYAGLQARGFSGALAAYAGFGLPAFILMLALTALYRHTEALPVTLVLFQGLRAVVVALIANAACNFAKTSIRSWPAAGLAGGAALALMIPISPILVIVGCAFVGVSLLPDAEKRTATLGASLNGHLLRATLTLVATAGAGIALLFWLDRLLFDLSVTMLQIDLVAFGGGFASVPLMQHEVVEARGWMTARTFMDGIALGQITPGPIVITATFAGYLVRGIAGAVVATLTVFLPSFVLVALIAPHFDRLQRLVVFRGATRGALVSFVGLLASVTVRFAFATSWTIETAILALVAFGALRLRIDVLWVVLGGVLLSVLAAR